MPFLLVDDLELPPEQRSLAEHLQTVLPEYKVSIQLRESAWVEHAIETVTIFLTNHPETAAVAGYVLKAVADTAIGWAKQHFKKYPENRKPKKIVIYGPDHQPVRTILVKDDDVSDE